MLLGRSILVLATLAAAVQAASGGGPAGSFVAEMLPSSQAGTYLLVGLALAALGALRFRRTG